MGHSKSHRPSENKYNKGNHSGNPYYVSTSGSNHYENLYRASGSSMNEEINGNRVNLFYEYYKKPRNHKEKCYTLHSFPLEFKFSKGKNTTSATNTHVTSVDSSDGKFYSTHGNSGDTQGYQNLTQDQYN